MFSQKPTKTYMRVHLRTKVPRVVKLYRSTPASSALYLGPVIFLRSYPCLLSERREPGQAHHLNRAFPNERRGTRSSHALFQRPMERAHPTDRVFSLTSRKDE